MRFDEVFDVDLELAVRWRKKAANATLCVVAHRMLVQAGVDAKLILFAAGLNRTPCWAGVALPAPEKRWFDVDGYWGMHSCPETCDPRMSGIELFWEHVTERVLDEHIKLEHAWMWEAAEFIKLAPKLRSILESYGVTFS